MKQLEKERDTVAAQKVERCEKALLKMTDIGVWLGILLGKKGSGQTVLDVRETDACVTCIEDACKALVASQDLFSEHGEDFDGIYANSDAKKANLDAARKLVDECRKAVKPGLLYLDANASERLKTIREELRETEKELRETLELTCAELFDEGLIPEKQVVFRRDRYCIPVKRGMQSLSPSLKGALTLGESKTGQTVYIEPKFCVSMNNNLVRLRSEDAKEEKRILSKLSKSIRRNSAVVLDVYEQVVDVDLMFSRAKHAIWTRGTKPQFVEEDQKEVAHTIELEGVVHPVLLENALESRDEDGDKELKGVVPVDIVIPSHCKVLTISGPNTGGKTATMKTIALCVHMAKCGLFIHTSSKQQGDGHKRGSPQMVFFESLLADIGDNQSLESNLSTFSSHVTRLRDIVRIVEQSGDPNRVLVLLDEVGSGTNPKEGASIAVAILKHLRNHASLTVATTHFSELKQLAAKENKTKEVGEWLNASVAFDMDTLKPTYQLVTGESGLSNAMHIADAIGLDANILREAKKELQGMASFDPRQATQEDDVNASTVLDSLVTQQKRVENLATRSNKHMRKLEAAMDSLRLLGNASEGALEEAEGELDEGWAAQMASKLAEEEEEFYASCEKCANEAVSQFESGSWDQVRTDAMLRSIERSMKQRITELAVAAQMNQDEIQSIKSEADKVLWRPKRGDRVKMKKLGGTRAVVVSVNTNNNTVTLKKGSVTLTSSVSDLSPM